MLYGDDLMPHDVRAPVNIPYCPVSQNSINCELFMRGFTSLAFMATTMGFSAPTLLAEPGFYLAINAAAKSHANKYFAEDSISSVTRYKDYNAFQQVIADMQAGEVAFYHNTQNDSVLYCVKLPNNEHYFFKSKTNSLHYKTEQADLKKAFIQDLSTSFKASMHENVTNGALIGSMASMIVLIFCLPLVMNPVTFFLALGGVMAAGYALGGFAGMALTSLPTLNEGKSSERVSNQWSLNATGGSRMFPGGKYVPLSTDDIDPNPGITNSQL